MACEHSIKDYQPSLSVMFENNKKQRAEVKIQNLKVISTIHTWEGKSLYMMQQKKWLTFRNAKACFSSFCLLYLLNTSLTEKSFNKLHFFLNPISAI